MRGIHILHHTLVRGTHLSTKQWNGDYNSRRGTLILTLTLMSWTENKGREIYPCVRSCWQNNILIAELLEKLSIKSLLCRMRSTQNLLQKITEETERKKAKQTWEFRRGSHVCMSEVNPPSPQCWHLSLWHLQLQPLSWQGRCMYVCARVCLMSQRSGYIQNYSHRNQLHMKTLTKAIHHSMSRTLTMR